MKKKIKNIIVSLNLINIFSILFYIFRIFKLKNQIVCVNFSGKGYGDSPKYIVEKIIEKKENVKIYWCVKDLKVNELPEEIIPIKMYSLKYFYILSTSKVWINNSRFPQFVRKRKGQFYLQTWHSPLRFKKIEMDAEENLSKYYKKVMKNDSKMIDLMISGCDFSYNIYSNSFLYNGNILKCGTPRCDLFWDDLKKNEIIKKLKKKYSIDFNKKTILYAPTFRVNVDIRDVMLDVEKLQESVGKDYNVLLKFHPRNKIEFDKRDIINVSDYPDMQELICISDILITDYSSCMFDALIANKVCLLYFKDIENYTKNERGVYFKLDELPFQQFSSDENIIEYIKKGDYKEYYKKIDSFNKKIGLYEKGNASEQLSQIIVDKLKG